MHLQGLVCLAKKRKLVITSCKNKLVNSGIVRLSKQYHLKNKTGRTNLDDLKHKERFLVMIELFIGL